MRKIFAISLAALVLFGCAKEADTVIGKKVSYQVKIESTKAVLADGTNSGYSIKWKEGDKIAFQLSDDSVQEAVVTVDGTGAHVSVTLPDATSVTDAWFPSNNKVKPTGIPAIQVAETMNIPLVKSSIAGKTITFTEVVDWAIIRVPLKKGANGDARKLQFIKVKTNNAALNPQVIQLNTNATLTDEVQNFDFVVPVGEYTPVEFIVRDSHGLEYRRKAAANFTTASHTVYSINTIDDVDDTGRYTWIFKGEDGPAGNKLSQNAPFTYWFPFYGSPAAAHHSDITRGADYWTEAPNVSGSKNNFYFAITANISGQGKSSSEWGSVAESKTTINGAANQVMRFPVHTGNYPILGFKVTKLDLLGTGMKVRLDVNSTQDTSAPGTNTYVGRYMPVRYTGATENRHQTLSEDGEAGTGVYYIDLSASNVQFKNGTTESNETLPNTRTLHFTTFNLQFRDIVPGTAGTMDIYWIGFFNSRSELETFAAAH